MATSKRANARFKTRQLALLAASLGAAAWGQRSMATGYPIDGVLLYTLGAALFVRCAGSVDSSLPSGIGRVHQAKLPSPSRPGAALVALALCLSSAGLWLFNEEGYLLWAWGLYACSVGLVLAAGYVLDRRLPNFGEPTARGRLLQGISLVAILGLAAFLRLCSLGELPAGCWYDEAAAGLEARKILARPAHLPPFWPSIRWTAYLLVPYAAALRLFGDSITSLRLVSAALGTAGVAAAYFFGREFFSPQLALVFAFLLATGRWHINFSRIAMTGIDCPLFELATLYFLLKGIRTGKRLHFSCAGLCLGLGLSIYDAFRLFPIVVALFLAYYAWSHRSAIPRRALATDLALMALATLVTVAPLANYALTHPDMFWSRVRQTSIFNEDSSKPLPGRLIQNAKAHLLMFNYRGDRNGRHNLPGEPMLDHAGAALFVLGLAYAIRHIGSPRYFLLVTWWAVMLCPGIFSLSFEAPQALRTIGSLPAAYAMAVETLRLCKLQGDGLELRTCKVATSILAACLLAYIGRANYDIYFHRQAHDFACWNAFSTPQTILARELNSLGEGYRVEIDPLLAGHPTIEFLAPGRAPSQALDPATLLPLRESGPQGVAIFLDPGTHLVRDLIEQYYPHLAPRSFRAPSGGPVVLYEYVFTPQDVIAVQGMVASYHRDEKVILERVEREWGLEVPAPCEAQWQAALWVPRWGSYRFRLHGGTQAIIELDGQRVTGSVPLAQGLHALTVQAHLDDTKGIELLWKTPADEGFTPVPFSHLFLPPVEPMGLIGRYYPNDGWQGEPAFARVDPVISFYFHLTPLPRPYTVEWEGRLIAPRDGLYAFGTENISASWLELDGNLILTNEEQNVYKQAAIYLTRGYHHLRLRFLDDAAYSHIHLYWKPPGATAPQLLNSSYLRPFPRQPAGS